MRTNFLLSMMLVSVASCTSLGPMPATTGISAMPMERPSVELNVGVAPGYYLSANADEEVSGTEGTTGPQSQSLVFEPDDLFRVKGLVLAVRRFGEGGDAVVEPIAGYRRRLTEMVSVIGLGHASRADGEDNGASYDATRIGGEIGVDAGSELFAGWLRLHAFASLSAMYLDAEGTYCVDASDLAMDCADDSRRVMAEMDGLFAAGTAGIAADLFKRPTGTFHGVRAALSGSYGTRPRLERMTETRDDYYSFGLSLSVAFGADGAR